MMTSGLVSSRTFPSSFIERPAWSSCSGFSSGGRVNMYGVWHVPTAATISPISDSLVRRVYKARPALLVPILSVHRPIDPVQQSHRLHAARRARLGLASLANRADELDVLAIEGGNAVELHVFALAVGHRIPIDLVGLLLADIPIEAAEGPLVVERHRHAEDRSLLRFHGDGDVHRDLQRRVVRTLLTPDLPVGLIQDPVRQIHRVATMMPKQVV